MFSFLLFFNVANSFVEYINTLELDIAERDRFLIAIRSELDSTQSENQALRREIDVSSTLYLADVL